MDLVHQPGFSGDGGSAGRTGASGPSTEAALPARKWGSKWMLWLQDFLTALTFFA